MNVLDKVALETEEKYKKVTLEQISQYTNRRQMIRNYLMKYTQNYIDKRVRCLQKWAEINNLKKVWGKRRLRALLLNVTKQMNDTVKQTLNVFKANRMEKKKKKLAQYHRTFSEYGINLSKFIHLWRYNSTNIKI